MYKSTSSPKTITTLVPDIYALFGSGHVPSDENLSALTKAMAFHITNALAKREPNGTLRASNIGTPCERQLHYKVHSPEEEEDPSPNAKFKFLYGHLIEEVTLFLAREAGHTVEGEQEEVEVLGIKGHTDGIVDGVVIDVKSANSRGMDKFKKHELETDDPFGYLDQINFYAEGLKDDERVKVKGQVAFLAVDKEMGHIVLDLYRTRPSEDTREAIAQKLRVTADSNRVPPRGFLPSPDGKSGNTCLGLECKYCGWKNKCYPGLRTFLYSNGPRYLTHVAREPDVPEITPERISKSR